MKEPTIKEKTLSDDLVPTILALAVSSLIWLPLFTLALKFSAWIWGWSW